MREIKFRVFNELGLVAGNVKLENAHYYVFDGDNITEQGANIFVQYTGLKDKNGREIYEGDIVQFKHEQSDVWEVSEVVYFGDGEWQYPAFDLNAGNLKSHFEAHVLQTIVCSGEYDYKVVGNIYENPELLEVAE